MKTVNFIFSALLLVLSTQSIAGDSSVGYAFMQKGQFEKAYSEYRPLAERGYSVYMNIVADMHKNGQGVPPSDLMAHVWYSLSAALSNERGIDGKLKLDQKLNKQQLVDSQFLARDFAKNYLEPYVVSWKLKAELVI